VLKGNTLRLIIQNRSSGSLCAEQLDDVEQMHFHPNHHGGITAVDFYYHVSLLACNYAF
jgi:hypothetical protein